MSVPVHKHIRLPKDRITTLEDGIFAFSMTLLVTTIEIPSRYTSTPLPDPVAHILLKVIPDFLHYIVAFVILAVFWYLEHQRFLCVTWIDRKIVAMTVVTLIFVALIPFSSNLAGDYPADPLGGIVFELNVMAIGLSSFAQWKYMRKTSDLCRPTVHEATLVREMAFALVLPVLSVLGIALALLKIPYSVIVYALFPVFFLLSDRIFPLSPAEEQALESGGSAIQNK